MGKIASWGPMIFQTSPSQVVPFDGFGTSVSLKTDTQSDTSGTSQTNTRGLELQPMSFSTTYMTALGAKPQARLDEWTSLVGKSHPLYIGGKRFGPAKMTLKKVESSDFLFGVNGEILKVTVKITLEEYSTKTTVTAKASSSMSSKKKSSGGSSGSTSSQQQAMAKYEETVEQQKAMKATASKEDRAARKPGGNPSKTRMVMLN